MPQANRKTDLTPIQPPDPDRLDCEYVINPYDQEGPLMCKFCRENKGSTKRPQECAVRLRWALKGEQQKHKALQDQFDVLKAEALAAEALIRCTCIQTHAPTCKAVTRPVDLAAPWIGMVFYADNGVDGVHTITKVEGDKIHYEGNTEPSGRGWMSRSVWDWMVKSDRIKAEKP
tara:strand:+ start:4320 stop:4841 length:522 start_codon:yes stop_codon:yes gene_type:complete